MTERTYLDFDLLVERSAAGYAARVLNSPAGQAAGKFALPFSDLEIENFVLRVGRTRRGVRRLDSPEMEAAKNFGGRLFEAVLGGPVRACLHSSLDQAQHQGAGLRIRLRLTDAPELIDLPWEYLYDADRNRFLSLSVETPLVRYPALPDRIQPLAVQPPLRVLVMISSPSDHPQLNVEEEWVRLKEAVGDLENRGLIKMERLEQATLAALQRSLRRGAYHVFHFIGHGAFDRSAQDGVLLLEDENGRGRPVSGQYIGTLLHDERTLRLAILNACEGARTSQTDPFAGTAQSLVQQGIPAVIAMQFEITDEASITLAHEFYASLADGYPVDASLAEARKALFAQGNDVEWGIPVLYLRAPDGKIFDVERVSEEERKRQQIAALYSEAQAALAAEDWPTATEKLQAILALDPTHPEAMTRIHHIRQRQQLAVLYTQGRKHYDAGRWRDSVRHFRRIQEIDAGYRDVGALLAIAERELAHKQPEPSPQPGPVTPGRWLRVAIPVALVLFLVIGGGIAYLALGSGDPTPDPMAEVVVDPTDTPQPASPTPTVVDSTAAAATATADWLLRDDDGDGLANNKELELNTLTDQRDSDGDGLDDGAEIGQGTDPRQRDTDGDGMPDGSDAQPKQTPTPVPLRFAYVHDNSKNLDIYVADADGAQKTCWACSSCDEAEPAWSLGGDALAYHANCTGSYDIWIRDKDGSFSLAQTATWDEREPDWSPDGSEIVFWRRPAGSNYNSDGELWRMARDGSGADFLGVRGRAPAWSPDGRYIAFMSERTGRWQIYVYDFAGRTTRQLSNCSQECRFPAWSPDSQYVVYHSATDSYVEEAIWRVPLSGGQATKLIGSSAGRPSWSRQGFLVFNSKNGIEVANEDGIGRRTVIWGEKNWGPTWSE